MDPTSPNHPEYWNSRYLSGQTPWDFGAVPAGLQEYIRRKVKGSNPNARGRVLIPGCGTGYELKAFADAGFAVTALDISTVAVERARQLVGPAQSANVLHGDFFSYDFGAAAFDLIYERNFLCAITPDRREAYRDRVAQLLKYRGSLLGYFYYQKPDLTSGAPFGFAWGTADDLFARYFLLGKDTPVSDSLPVFAGRERWQEWHRTSYECPV